MLEKLHAVYPQAAISVLVRKGNEGIYQGHPFLREVLVWDKQKRKIRNLFALLAFIRQTKYDVIINCHRYASSGFLTGFSGARHTAGFKQNPFSFLFNYTVKHIIGDGSHEVERYHRLVSDFVPDGVYMPRLYPTIADEAKVAPYKGEPYVCMAPASVWFTKQLPKEKWIELGMQIRDKRIFLLGAPSDKQQCAEIAQALKGKDVLSLAGELSLLQSCALMKDAQMNYVNDSAPLHLASAVNAPVTAFFCSTVPAFGFTPLSEQRRIVEVNTLSCRPCGLHGYKTCPMGHFKCGNEIDLRTLVDA